jgi:DNA-directed RNA polymerase subunit RPC12/RpoP
MRRTIATGREVSIRGRSEVVEPEVLFKLLDSAMRTTKEAIQLTRQALYTSDVPNRLGTNLESLRVERIRCHLCEHRYLVPDALVELYREIDSIRCPNCLKNSPPKAIESIQVNQYVFGCILSSHLADLDQRPRASALPDWGGPM